MATLQYFPCGRRIFLHIACVMMSIYALQESDVGKHDWYNRYIGDIFQAHYRDECVFLVSRQNLIAAASPTDIRDIKWRRVFDQTIQSVHFSHDSLWAVFANGQCMVLDYSNGYVKKEVYIEHSRAIIDSVYVNGKMYASTSDNELISFDENGVLWRLPVEAKWLLVNEKGLLAISSSKMNKLSFNGQLQSTEELGSKLTHCTFDCKRQSLFCTDENSVRLKLNASTGNIHIDESGLTAHGNLWLCSDNQCKLMYRDTPHGLVVEYMSKTWEVPYTEKHRLTVDSKVRFVHSDGVRALIVTEEWEAYCFVRGQLTSRSDQGLAAVRNVVISPPVVVMTTESSVMVGIRISDGHQLWRLGNLDFRPVLVEKCSGILSFWRNGQNQAKILTIDPTNGKVLDSKVIVDGNVHYSKDSCSLWRKDNDQFDLIWKNSSKENDVLIVSRKDPNILECQLTSGKRLWTAKVGPDDAKIVRVAFKSDRIARTNWMILPDRSVIHRRLDTDIVVALSYSEQFKCLYVYVFKAQTGQVLYAKAHRKAKGPFMITGAENSIVYTFQNPQSELDFSPRTQLTTVSLFHEDQPTFDKIILPNPPRCIAISVTQKGITSRSLLMGTADGHLFEINWDFSSLQYKRYSEGLILQAPDQTMINFYNLMRRCRHIVSAPHSRSESRSHVVAYGLDIFSTVIQPSKSFDTLSDDVNKKFILVLVFVLLLAAFGSRYWARRCALKSAWE